MELVFKPAEEEDIPAIFQLACDLVDAYEDPAVIDRDKVFSWMHNKISRNILQYTCVRLDGNKAAYYRLCEDGELDDLYVLSPLRGQGIGSRILEKCIAESEKHLYLYVFSGNTRAVSLYQRFGFSVTETVGKTRYIMSRNG